MPPKWYRFQKKLPLDVLEDMNQLWAALALRIVNDPQAGIDPKTGKRRVVEDIAATEIVGFLCATVYNAWEE